MYVLKISKDDFKKLSNKERAEIYADIKSHDDVYYSSNLSFLKRIHEKRLSSLRTLMGDISDKKILDAGSGEGFFLASLNCKEKIGVELSQKRIDKALKLFPELKVKLADVKELPFEDNSFDVILCSEVLEHVSNYEKAISEFKRCIRSNGCLILSFPNESTVSLGRLLLLRFPIHEIDHVNVITPKDIIRILGSTYKSLNVPNIPYPFCLYQVYRFDAKFFK